MDNNENKILLQILGRLESMDNRFDSIDNRLDSMDKRFDTIDNRLDTLEQGQARLTERVDHLAEGQELLRDSMLKLELVEVPKIQLALEGLSSHKSTADDHEVRVTALESTVSHHSTQIAALKAAQD